MEKSKNIEINKYKKNLCLTGLVALGMIGLNYLGYQIGLNTDLLAMFFALTLTGTVISVETNIHLLKTNHKKI